MNTKLGFFWGGGGGSVNAFLVLLVSYFWSQKYVENSEKGNWVLDVLHMVLKNEFLLSQVH